MGDMAIRVENLSKRYTISEGRRNDTLRDQLSDSVASLFRGRQRKVPDTKTFWALKDVSFEVKQGQTVGIIGHNGAGKSTLLKLLSQITEPTTGRAEIFGRVGSLLEVGTGFHPELTGRENVYLNGAIIGMSREEIRRQFDAIVEFSEIGQFIDMPVKRYSSGMYVRLAFAVSAHLKPEILILDEVLSVGDFQFQRKCMAYTEKLRKSNSTILIVSHNMFAIKHMCSRVLFLAGGKVICDGTPAEAIELYEGGNQLTESEWARQTIGTDPSQWPAQVTEVETFDINGQPSNLFNFGERMRVRVKYRVRETIASPNFLVAFTRSDDVTCCNFNTVMDGVMVSSLSTDGSFELLTPPLKLVADSYKVHILIRDATFERLYCAYVGKTFHVRHGLLNTHFGVFHEPGEWFMSDEVVERNITNCSGGLCHA